MSTNRYLVPAIVLSAQLFSCTARVSLGDLDGIGGHDGYEATAGRAAQIAGASNSPPPSGDDSGGNGIGGAGVVFGFSGSGGDYSAIYGGATNAGGSGPELEIGGYYFVSTGGEGGGYLVSSGGAIAGPPPNYGCAGTSGQLPSCNVGTAGVPNFGVPQYAGAANVDPEPQYAGASAVGGFFPQ